MMSMTPVKLHKVLPAPCADVFDLWLDAEDMHNWMCPGNMRATAVEINPVVGGAFRIDMQMPDGMIYVHSGRYLTIQRPQKLVFTWQSSATDDRPSRVRLEFREHTEGCELSLTHEQLPDALAANQHRAGWKHIIELLSDYAVD